MAWEPIGKPRPQLATVRLAKEFVAMKQLDQERKLRATKMAKYKRLLEEGKFRDVAWATAYCAEDKSLYRVNGQYTSNLFAAAEPGQLQGLYVTISEFRADTLHDVADLYSTYDSKDQSRSHKDINRTFASTIEEFDDLSPALIDILVSALALSRYPEREPGSDGLLPQDRAAALADHIPVCLWVGEVIGAARHKQSAHLWRSPVVAAMMACWHKNRAEATLFWESVRDETDPTPEAPSRRLAKFLLTTAMEKGARSGTPKRFRTKSREYYVKSQLAWNAFRRKESTTLKYHANAKLGTFV